MFAAIQFLPVSNGVFEDCQFQGFNDLRVAFIEWVGHATDIVIGIELRHSQTEILENLEEVRDGGAGGQELTLQDSPADFLREPDQVFLEVNL